MALKLVASEKGQEKLHHDYYFYVQDKAENSATSKIIWRCLEYTTKKECRGRAHTFREE